MKNINVENEFGYTQEGKVFIKSYLGYPERQIGIVRNTDQEALDYFVNRFALAQSKVEKLESQIEEAQNKGSYLTKLVQLRKSLLEFDGLGNFIPLLEKLDLLQNQLEGLIVVNQAKNLEIKTALINDAKAISNIEDWKQATIDVQELKTKWLKTGPIDKSKEEVLEAEFNEICDEFFHQRREYFIIKNKEIDERIVRSEDLINMVFRLRYEQDIDQAFQKIKEHQAEFRNIGEIPPKKKKALWRNFKKANDLFFELYNRAKGIVPKVRLDPYQQALVDLCAKAESLVNVPPGQYVTASESAKNFLIEWKTNAPKVKYIDKTLAENFRAACDKIFEMNYLVRVIGYRHPEFNAKPRIEQLKIMINQMDYLVRKEKNELEISIHNQDSFRSTEENDRQNLLKINTQKRKIAMKDILLESFKKELEGILGQ
ncbi:MAG: DUF349 domain-containing protein [Bacteroidota bacterium]